MREPGQTNLRVLKPSREARITNTSPARAFLTTTTSSVTWLALRLWRDHQCRGRSWSACIGSASIQRSCLIGRNCRRVAVGLADDDKPTAVGEGLLRDRAELAARAWGCTIVTLLPQRCGGRYFDENGNEVRGPIEPVGDYGLHSYRTIDDTVSEALGIDRVPE